MSREEYRKNYYKNNSDKIKASSTKRYLLNKEKILLRHAERYRNEKSYVSIILERARHRAKTKDIPFNIDKSDIIIPDFCPLLGIKLQRNTGGRAKDNSPSIDKIIPHLGYTKGNVRIISYKANVMKNDATPKELITFCTNILKMNEE